MCKSHLQCSLSVSEVKVVRYTVARIQNVWLQPRGWMPSEICVVLPRGFIDRVLTALFTLLLPQRWAIRLIAPVQQHSCNTGLAWDTEQRALAEYFLWAPGSLTPAPNHFPRLIWTVYCTTKKTRTENNTSCEKFLPHVLLGFFCYSK